MENENEVEMDWMDKVVVWFHDAIQDHPYVTGGFLACQALSVGVGMLAHSFAAYFVTIGILGVILAFVAHEGN